MMDAYWLDKRAVRLAFERAAPTYDDVAVLQREVGNRLLERLDYIRLQPSSLLDLGCGTGESVQALQKRYKKSSVFALDLAHSMLLQAAQKQPRFSMITKRPVFVCADAECLPIASNSVDMIISNLALQWCNSVDEVFRECRRILRPGGLFMFTTFGPDTLKELRDSWRQVDGERIHVNRFLDLHDVGDALLRSHFSDPVMDMEVFTLTYPDIYKMMRELKALGAHNINLGRPVALTGKQRLQSLADAYEQFRQDERLPATYEVIYGHAWIPEQETRQTEQGNVETHVPLSSIGRIKNH